MIKPDTATEQLRDAAIRFGNFVAGWTSDTDTASGLTKADADVIGAHIDYVLLFEGPEIPLIAPEPDDGTIDTAFAHLAAFIAQWPVDRVDPVTQLSREDLMLIAGQQGPVEPRPTRPDFPPDIEDDGTVPPRISA